MDDIIAPPWQLTGNGYLLLFRFTQAFVLANGFVPSALWDRFQGGVGAVMLVEYHASGVGAFRELSFVPGVFNYAGTKRYTITKAFGSTISSVINGQENWGLPKEIADFQIQPTHNNADRIIVSRDGQPFTDITVRGFGPKLPVNTRLLPLNLNLGQEFGDKTYVTRPRGSGWVSLAQVIRADINERYFPDFRGCSLLVALRAADFKLTFPQPQTTPLQRVQILDRERQR